MRQCPNDSAVIRDLDGSRIRWKGQTLPIPSSTKQLHASCVKGKDIVSDVDFKIEIHEVPVIFNGAVHADRDFVLASTYNIVKISDIYNLVWGSRPKEGGVAPGSCLTKAEKSLENAGLTAVVRSNEDGNRGERNLGVRVKLEISDSNLAEHDCIIHRN